MAKRKNTYAGVIKTEPIVRQLEVLENSINLVRTGVSKNLVENIADALESVRTALEDVVDALDDLADA